MFLAFHGSLVFWIIDGLGIIKDETLSLLDERGGIVYVY